MSNRGHVSYYGGREWFVVLGLFEGTGTEEAGWQLAGQYFGLSAGDGFERSALARPDTVELVQTTVTVRIRSWGIPERADRKASDLAAFHPCYHGAGSIPARLRRV